MMRKKGASERRGRRGREGWGAGEERRTGKKREAHGIARGTSFPFQMSSRFARKLVDRLIWFGIDQIHWIYSVR